METEKTCAEGVNYKIETMNLFLPCYRCKSPDDFWDFDKVEAVSTEIGFSACNVNLAEVLRECYNDGNTGEAIFSGNDVYYYQFRIES